MLYAERSLIALSHPLLSIIIPAHNEERRLPRTLEQVFAFLRAAELRGRSADRRERQHRPHARNCRKALPASTQNLHVVRSAESGKGLAVRLGMLEARGEYRFMCDADLSMPIEEVNRFLPPALHGFRHRDRVARGEGRAGVTTNPSTGTWADG